MLPVAHIRNEAGKPVIDPLAGHLSDVAIRTKDFADIFGSGDWGFFAGLWHDIGKYRQGFQQYIRQCADPDAHIEGRISGADKTHSAAGALWAQAYLKQVDPRFGNVAARILSYLIAGHHAGLADWEDLDCRLKKPESQREWAEAVGAEVADEILRPIAALPSPAVLRRFVEQQPEGTRADIPGSFALWVRMLFSCLADADFLVTEQFMSSEKQEKRDGFSSLSTMMNRLTVHLEQFSQEVMMRGGSESLVNRQRRLVLASCLKKEENPPGIFSLTVPTGGGKTLSSLAFALHHAIRYSKRRIIYAIPYTSIIEQSASIFSGIFGEENIVEHHSSIDVDPAQETHRSRLACENWDAPLIVTTNVQLLESLFSNRTSRCRKLHNIANSVIILDEAQLLPVNYLQPVIDVLRLLVRDYGVTLVLCTATQPSLETHVGFELAHSLRGFAPGEIREIIDDVPALYRALNRIQIHVPKNLNQPHTWEKLAAELIQEDAVLGIVSRRADARDLYRQIHDSQSTKEGLWHLSGLMCARHRSDTLSQIRSALTDYHQAIKQGKSGKPVRVIATQLVEAGVDVDFPVVYRALAGLDSIAQAAGRCNREGRLAQGHIHVFVPPKPAPPGLLRMAEDATRALWNLEADHDDPLAIEHFSDYFRHLYGDAKLDEKEIVSLLKAGKGAEVKFRTVAERFHLIDEKDSATVFVRYQRNDNDEGIERLLLKLKNEGVTRWLLRKLQAYGVTVYRHDLERLLKSGDVIPLGSDCPGIYIQSPDNDILYDQALGLNVRGAPGDPGTLVI